MPINAFKIKSYEFKSQVSIISQFTSLC